jgi:hypothetical protein
MNITPQQLKAISTLVSKQNIGKEDKAVIVQGFTGGRATSTKDLTIDEAKAMLQHLKANDPDEKKAEKMRKKIIAIAHEMGWRKFVNSIAKADMKRIDDFCKTRGYKKKV